MTNSSKRNPKRRYRPSLLTVSLRSWGFWGNMRTSRAFGSGSQWEYENNIDNLFGSKECSVHSERPKFSDKSNSAGL